MNNRDQLFTIVIMIEGRFKLERELNQLENG